MSLFHKVEGAACVLRSKGVYRQVDVYERNGALFAKWASGYIGLRRSIEPGRGGTTLPDVFWDAVEGVAFKERDGALRITETFKPREAA